VYGYADNHSQLSEAMKRMRGDWCEDISERGEENSGDGVVKSSKL
jgi:hypothetical protein